MLLITIFVELRVVAGRSRIRAGSPQAVLCRGLEKNGTVRAWYGRGMGMAWEGMLCVNRPLVLHSKPLLHVLVALVKNWAYIRNDTPIKKALNANMAAKGQLNENRRAQIKKWCKMAKAFKAQEGKTRAGSSSKSCSMHSRP